MLSIFFFFDNDACAVQLNFLTLSQHIVFLLTCDCVYEFQSHSSVLTDDEGAGVHFKKSGSEKLRAVHAQKKVAELPLCKQRLNFMNFTSNILLVLKILQVGLVDMANGLHKAMRKELRHMETDVCEM